MSNTNASRVATGRAAVSHRKGGVATVVGSSMRPWLRPGARVMVCPLAEEPPLGTILLYRVGEHQVIHRLVRIEHDSTSAGGGVRWITKGDLLLGVDPPITPQQVVGRVVKVEGPWGPWTIDRALWRCLGWLVATAAPSWIVGWRGLRWRLGRVVQIFSGARHR